MLSFDYNRTSKVNVNVKVGVKKQFQISSKFGQV